MRSSFVLGSQQVIGAVALASIVLLALAPDASARPARNGADAEMTAQLRPSSEAAVRQQSCPCMLWSDEALPGWVAYPENRAVELGIKFRVAAPGFITGVRFFKSPENGGMHLGNLWAGDGQLLARAVFANESASGWQQVLFSAPVPVSPATTYVASYHTDVGYYSLNWDYFVSGGYELGPLRALANGEDGPNGVFRYGASGFPSDSHRSSNYWVTPIFTTQYRDAVPPTISSVQVTDVTATSATVRWQTDEPADSRVDFGPTTDYGGDAADGNRVMTHALRLDNLAPNTGYHARIRSQDAAGNKAMSGDFTFTTAIPPPPRPVGVCSPRPAVVVSAVRSGPGRLRVTVTAGTSSTTPANKLVALRFGPGSNALIDIGGQTGRTGEFTVALAGTPQNTTFYVQRAIAGQATTAPFVVIDDCGEFKSFVGGGASAF